MEMVTLHELSLLLDVSVRVLRARVRRLVLAGKLTEGLDYIREDFINETHFLWKISPVAFMRESGQQLVNPSGNQRASSVTHLDNQSPRAGTQTVSQPSLPAPPQPYQTLPKPDSAEPGLEREMIDLLKDQVRVKDGQISDLTGQNKELNSLNLKLTTRIVHQDDKIHDLLRLTGGKSELDDLVTKPVNRVVTQGPDLGTNGQPVGNQVGTQKEGGEMAA
jgi:hypothetical protein